MPKSFSRRISSPPLPLRVLLVLFVFLAVLAEVKTGLAASRAASGWRFSGHALLGVRPDGGTETVLDGITHVRSGAAHGSGSFERPYGSITEAVCAASARTTPQTIYIWAGDYISTGAMSIRADMTIAGSGTPLPLPSGGTLPAQTPGRPVWRAAELHVSACGVGRSGPVAAHSPSYCNYDDSACGGLLLVADKRGLRLIGLTLAGEQYGAAVVMGSEPGLLSSGSLEMIDCALSGFGLGVYSNGSVSLPRGNSFRDMLSYSLGTNGNPSDTIRIGDNNQFSGNRRGVYAPGGVVVIGHNNGFRGSEDAGVLGWDIRAGGGNVFSDNKTGLRASGSLHLGENNTVSRNAEDGAVAADMRIGDRNAITANGGKGLVLAAPLNKEQKPGKLILGNRNLISDNSRGGIESCGDIAIGDDNRILRNSRAASSHPAIGSQSGDIILGRGNLVTDNAQYGIAAFGGRIALGRDNRVTGNRAGGLMAGGSVVLGGGNEITGNSRAGRGEDVRLRGAFSQTSSDTVGTVNPGRPAGP